MTQLPDAMFVIDSNAEEIAVKEARRMVCRWFRRGHELRSGRVTGFIPGKTMRCARSRLLHFEDSEFGD